MRTDMDTDDNDGTACEGCGDRADGAIRMAGRGSEVALCTNCRDALTTPCAMCERVIWQREGYRLFKNQHLYCATCAKPWITAVATESEPDVFNQRRR